MPNKLFRYSFLVLFFITGLLGYGQQFYLETGLNTAFFKEYVNNSGENTLDLNYSKPQKPFIEAGFRINLHKDKVHWEIGTGYNTYQISTAFRSGNVKVPLEYNLNYASLKTGLNVTLITIRKLKLQIHSHFSYDLLTFGNNKYLNIVNDIYKEKTLDRTLLRYHIGALLGYEINNRIEAYLDYNVADSFKEENKDSNKGEKYVLRTNSVALGLRFKIEKTKKEEKPKKEERLKEEKLKEAEKLIKEDKEEWEF